jgi:hypothetical protein
MSTVCTRPLYDLEVLDHPADFLHRVCAGWRHLLFDHRKGRFEMFGLETATGVFAQLAAEEPLGLVVFDVIIAPPAAPAIGLTKFTPAAGRIHRAAELGGIDEGFDHQHRMAVDVLSLVRKNRNPSGGLYRCRRGSARDWRRTNARRFLMKALMLRPAPRLMHAFRQNPLGLSGYTAFFVLKLSRLCRVMVRRG